MKKFFFGVVVLTVFTAVLNSGFVAKARTEGAGAAPTTSTTLTISQVGQGGGGSTGTYLFD